MNYKIKIDREREAGTINPNIYGHFIEHMSRCIYGGIYEEGSSLSNEKGFRKDVMNYLKKIRTPIVRWPGGNFASGYHWEDGIGPQEKRKIKYDPVWRVEENNHFGTDEFLQFCVQINAEPYICLNLGNGTIEEAIHWVEYCNRKGNSYYAKLRGKNGRSQPYKVKYWGLGNEVFGEWQLGYKSAQDYAKVAKEFAKAIRWTDPETKIVLVGGFNDPEWDYEVLKSTGSYIDYVSTHIYFNFTCVPQDYYAVMAASKIMEERTKILKGTIDAATNCFDNKIGITWDEWNLWGWQHFEKERENDNNSSYTLQDALATASILNVFQRMSKYVTMACYSPVVNIRGAIFTHKEGIVLRPQYHVFDLYSNHSGETSLDVFVKSDYHSYCFDAGSFLIKKGKEVDIEYLDVSATYSDLKDTLFITVVNKHKDNSLDTQIILEGFNPHKVAQIYELTHENVLAYNDIHCPDEVKVNQKQIHTAGEQFDYQFPAHSLTVIEIKVN